jgi:hypothetical protein
MHVFNKKLSISIPTFNDLQYLKKNLEILLPQVKKHKNKVDLYIFDNCSDDGTKNFVESIFKNESNCFYYKNDENLGIFKNQLKCLEIPGYDFKIVLGSDDILLDGSISYLLNYLNSDYSLFSYNYYSYKEDYRIMNDTYADTSDKVFKRGYDLLNYPSVGHFSGFIFNSDCLTSNLEILKSKYDNIFFEKHRGIIAFLTAYICTKEKKKTMFIGKRCLATLYKKEVKYDSLEHLCIDYLEAHNELYSSGIANKIDFNYRKRLIRKILFKAVIRNIAFKSTEDNIRIKLILDTYFSDFKYKIFISPIFYFCRLKTFRSFMASLIYNLLKIRDR